MHDLLIGMHQNRAVQVKASAAAKRCGIPVLRKRGRQRNAQKNAEFLGEVAADPRVHAALLVEEPGAVAGGEHALVPDIGMDIEALAAVEPERLEMLGT